MSAKGVYEFYSTALVPLSPKAELVPLLKAVINCGETTKDFVWALRNDRELQTWLRQTVMAMGFEGKPQGLEQVITLIGQDKVRDILFGRSIENAFFGIEDTLMSRFEKSAKKKTPATNADGEEEPGDAPPIGEFVNYLTFAKRSEEVANAVRNSYPWQAYIGGLLYDYLYNFVRSRKVTAVEGLKRSDLANPKVYVETMFNEGIRSALAAVEVLQKITIKYQKNVFVAALLSNSGKLIQYGFDPIAYQATLNAQDQRKSLGVTQTNVAEEHKVFVFDNAQMASLFVGRLPFLQEIERALDYAGSPKILRMRDSNLYALHAVLKIATDLAKIFQAERATQADIQKISDESIRKSDEFSFLKLSLDEWKSVKSNFALKIMKANL